MDRSIRRADRQDSLPRVLARLSLKPKKLLEFLKLGLYTDRATEGDFDPAPNSIDMA
jgi:hypothetical protein